MSSVGFWALQDFLGLNVRTLVRQTKKKAFSDQQKYDTINTDDLLCVLCLGTSKMLRQLSALRIAIG